MFVWPDVVAIIWACNAGVVSQGTYDGFDVVTVDEYLEDHDDMDFVSFYNNIHEE